MKKVLIILICGMILMVGCSRDMLSHTTEKGMNKLVKRAVRETHVLDEVIDEEDTNDRITYMYLLEDRDIYFRAISSIDDISIDGSVFGYTHSDSIYYEVDIVSDENNLKLRNEKADSYGLYDEACLYKYDAYFITLIESYEQLDEMAEYLIDMDYIYDFDEKNMSKIKRVENHLGYMKYGEWEYTFATIEYAPYGDKKLDYDQLYPYLEKEYVLMVKRNGILDSTIPRDVYDKYEPETDEE